jgi:hypothetical protein
MFREWLEDCRLALEIYCAIRHNVRYEIDRENNRFEIEWYSGPRRTAMQRVVERRAEQGLHTQT